jgi:hypothetical protein
MIYLRTLLLIIICINVYGQSRLSPKFHHNAARATDANNDLMIFSVSVKEPAVFIEKYRQKISIKNRRDHFFHVNAAYSLVVSEMASDQNILFIDIVQRATTEAGIDFVNPAFNRITKVHAVYPSLVGNNQNVSIKESSFDRDNIDLINRSFTTVLTPSDISQHATTMATLIAGGGNSSSKALGAVPSAQITSSSFATLLPDADEIFLENNIHLQNHSYGVLIENYYGNEAVAYDEQILYNPTLVHVFSAGNIGNTNPSAGTYASLPYANLSGNFKQAKNIISTTAVDTSFQVNMLNSKGPAYDGRLKPELAAYGQGGTSDAAATVTGITALMQDKYSAMHGSYPLTSTIKAVLIATADDIGPEGIDFIYGYGNANAFKAITLIAADDIIETTLKSNDVVNVPITVDNDIALLKVAVVWTDPPALENSTTALVNDIDCEISDGTVTYLPWVLNHYPKADSLSAKAKRKQDHLNNVEYFTIENPAAGNFSLTLHAPELATPDQIVSIAYWHEKKEFTWDYPDVSDVLEGNQKHTLFWSYPVNATGDLYFELNGGDWQLLKESIDLSKYQHWKTPDTLATAKLKMVIDGNEYISGQFTISPKIKLSVAYNCNEAFSLSWESVKGATSYQVYTLGEKYLEEITNTSDTSAMFQKSNQNFFAVAPMKQSITGLKSQTINYDEQGAFCYINLFSAQRFEANQVTIQLKLSTIINVATIKIYKTVQGTESLLLSTAPSGTTDYEFADSTLSPGTVSYRVELVLKTGALMPSATTTILIEKPNKATLFPNPVTNDDMLSVLTEGNGLIFEILSNLGQPIIITELQLHVEEIETRNLPPGIYLYVLRRNNKSIDSGHFMKN